MANAMFTQIQEKRAQWKQQVNGLGDVNDEPKAALEHLYFRVFGSDPVQVTKKAHADFDTDEFSRVADLDVNLPAVKAEVQALKAQTHQNLVDYWAEKLRLRSELILSKYGPDPKAQPTLDRIQGDDHIASLTENLGQISASLSEVNKKMPAVHTKSNNIRRAVVERGEKRKAPSVTEQVIEEERTRKRPKGEEKGVGTS